MVSNTLNRARGRRLFAYCKFCDKYTVHRIYKIVEDLCSECLECYKERTGIYIERG